MTAELITKLISVQDRLHAPKTQLNKFAGYKYRSCEDILEAVKPLLSELGLVLYVSDELVHFPSTDDIQVVTTIDSKGKEVSEVVGGDRFYVKATATITDGETSFSTSAFARESSSKKGSDDSQLTGSTSSYARKYALNGLFLIDDSKDADTNEHANERQSRSTGTPPPPKAIPIIEDQERRAKVNSGLHAKVKHNQLHAWANKQGWESLNDAPLDMMLSLDKALRDQKQLVEFNKKYPAASNG